MNSFAAKPTFFALLCTIHFCLSSAAAQDCKPRWDVSIGTPGFDYEVSSLAVHDDGTGPALYAGGRFQSAGDTAAWRIAKWDGVQWLALDSGIGGGINDFASEVYALAEFDDGAGPGLFAAGYFQRAGNIVAARSIAVWRDGAWSDVGGGFSAPNGSLASIQSLVVFDDGTGPALYAGGAFLTAGSRIVNSIARWDGSSWTALGTGLLGSVSSMAVFDDGRGPALFVTGQFRDPVGSSRVAIAKWNGRSWERLAGGTPSGEWSNYSPCPIGWLCPVYDAPRGDALTTFDAGSGNLLFLAGSFNRARGVKLRNPALWTGRTWMNLAGGFVDSRIMTLATHDDGQMPALYAGGFFSMAGDVMANSIAKWDGDSWHTLGSGVYPGPVLAMATFDDGTGPALYVGGNMTTVGGKPTGNIARWICSN